MYYFLERMLLIVNGMNNTMVLYNNYNYVDPTYELVLDRTNYKPELILVLVQLLLIRDMYKTAFIRCIDDQNIRSYHLFCQHNNKCRIIFTVQKKIKRYG